MEELYTFDYYFWMVVIIIIDNYIWKKKVSNITISFFKFLLVFILFCINNYDDVQIIFIGN